MKPFAEPVTMALIGTGNRAQGTYRPIIAALAPWAPIVAVCDPVREHADAMAADLGVPAFYSIRDLVRARPMEAALVVTPVPSHHSISCYLSEHGIHNQVETSMASTLAQAQDMVRTARRNKVILRVAENFFRFPFDRMAQRVDETGFIGEVKRIISVYDHTGFHNNSRWVRFYSAHPIAAQAISHTMPVAPHYEAPHRFHTSEEFRSHYYTFPGDRLVVDLAANIKGCLGRMPRPGYTEFAGSRGTIIGETTGTMWIGRGEVRYCSDEALQSGGRADQVFPITDNYENGQWTSSHVDLPIGRVEYVTPFRYDAGRQEGLGHFWGATIMDHVVGFAAAVRGQGPSEFTDEDALMSMMMEVATRESAQRGGVRLALPLSGELEAERQVLEAQRKEYGVDPLDVEAMLNVSFPRP